MTVSLSRAALTALPNGVAAPRYAPADLTPGIVHFGVGNFHRAHQAVYLDDLFNAGIDRDWAIVGAGVLPAEAAGRAKLETQDWLTTVVDVPAQPTSTSDSTVASMSRCRMSRVRSVCGVRVGLSVTGSA